MQRILLFLFILVFSTCLQAKTLSNSKIIEPIFHKGKSECVISINYTNDDGSSCTGTITLDVSRWQCGKIKVAKFLRSIF